MKSWLKKFFKKESKTVCIVFVNRKDISAKCICDAVSSPFLARFFILLLTKASASFLLSSTLDSGLFQVNGDKAGLTAWGQPMQDGTTDTAFSTSAFVYSAFIDFAQNVTVTLCNQQQKRMKDGQQRSLLPTQTLAAILGDRAPFSLRAGEKGLSHTLPAEQPALQTLTPASIVVSLFPSYTAAPRLVSSSCMPRGWDDLIQGVSLWFTHCRPHHHADCLPAQGAAKPGTGAGGGEEGWEEFAPRSTAEANTLCNLILQG